MADNVQKNDVNIEEEKSSQEDEKKRKDKLALRDIRDFLIKLAFIVVLGWVLLGVVFGVAVMEGGGHVPPTERRRFNGVLPFTAGLPHR